MKEKEGEQEREEEEKETNPSTIYISIYPFIYLNLYLSNALYLPVECLSLWDPVEELLQPGHNLVQPLQGQVLQAQPHLLLLHIPDEKSNNCQ